MIRILFLDGLLFFMLCAGIALLINSLRGGDKKWKRKTKTK